MYAICVHEYLVWRVPGILLLRDGRQEVSACGSCIMKGFMRHEFLVTRWAALGGCWHLLQPGCTVRCCSVMHIGDVNYELARQDFFFFW